MVDLSACRMMGTRRKNIAVSDDLRVFDDGRSFTRSMVSLGLAQATACSFRVMGGC